MSQLGLNFEASKLYDPEVLNRALNMIRESAPERDMISNPKDAADLAVLRLSGQEREYMLVMFLDNRNALISDEILFAGTIDAAEDIEDMDPSVDFRVGIVSNEGEQYIGIDNVRDDEMEHLKFLCDGKGLVLSVVDC